MISTDFKKNVRKLGNVNDSSDSNKRRYVLKLVPKETRRALARAIGFNGEEEREIVEYPLIKFFLRNYSWCSVFYVDKEINKFLDNGLDMSEYLTSILLGSNYVNQERHTLEHIGLNCKVSCVENILSEDVHRVEKGIDNSLVSVCSVKALLDMGVDIEGLNGIEDYEAVVFFLGVITKENIESERISLEAYSKLIPFTRYIDGYGYYGCSKIQPINVISDLSLCRMVEQDLVEYFSNMIKKYKIDTTEMGYFEELRQASKKRKYTGSKKLDYRMSYVYKDRNSQYREIKFNDLEGTERLEDLSMLVDRQVSRLVICDDISELLNRTHITNYETCVYLSIADISRVMGEYSDIVKSLELDGYNEDVLLQEVEKAINFVAFLDEGERGKENLYALQSILRSIVILESYISSYAKKKQEINKYYFPIVYNGKEMYNYSKDITNYVSTSDPICLVDTLELIDENAYSYMTSITCSDEDFEYNGVVGRNVEKTEREDNVIIKYIEKEVPVDSEKELGFEIQEGEKEESEKGEVEESETETEKEPINEVVNESTEETPTEIPTEIPTEKEKISDPYMETTNVYTRLWKELDEQGRLVIAYDFDGTIYDAEGTYQYDYMKKLLVALRPFADFIVFTDMPEYKYKDIKKYLENEGIPYDTINADVVDRGYSRKIFYNALLDDRAGLYECSKILELILYNKTNSKSLEEVLSKI